MEDVLQNQILMQLDKLEKKVDALTEVTVKIARTEERVVLLMENDTQKARMIGDLQSRVNDLESARDKQGVVLKWAERAFWIIATAGASVLAWKFK